MLNKYDEQFAEQEQLKNQISQQKDLIDKQQSNIDKQSTDIADLQEQLIHSVTDDTGKATAEYLLEKLENQEIVLQNQDAVIKELQALIKKDDKTSDDDPGDNEKKGVLRCIVHTVQSGESLSRICKEYDIDYNATKNIILAFNGITNPDLIHVGQKIIIPIFDDEND